MMIKPNLLLFYVKDPAVSSKFYEQLFGMKPSASFPNYVCFEFDNGMTFALWSLSAKNFVSGGTGHRCELAFMVDNEATVRALRTRWGEADVEIEQELHEAVFGLTFVALDPDAHRIRVCLPDK